jgi:PAS domain-containing protein
MQAGAWVKEFPAQIIVLDTSGVILEMNDRACEALAGGGGRDLVGRNALDCHPEPSRSKLQQILDGQLTNCYTTEKNGVKKLIYQAPWYEGKKYMGLVEVGIELPADVPHFTRG